MAKRKKSITIKSKKKTKKQKVTNISIEEERNELKRLKSLWGGKQFEVEKIINKKYFKNRIFYLVKWAGWDNIYNEWVNEKGK